MSPPTALIMRTELPKLVLLAVALLASFAFSLTVSGAAPPESAAGDGSSDSTGAGWVILDERPGEGS